MSNHSELGFNLRRQATNVLNRTSVYEFVFKDIQKHEDAAILFTNSGNAFKMANMWQEAGESFILAATSHGDYNVLSNSENNNKATSLIEAANCFKKVNLIECINAYTDAINVYTEKFNFKNAGKYSNELALIYQNDDNIVEALRNFENSFQLYENAGEPLKAKQILLTVAEISSTQGNFNKAIEIYEKISKDDITHHLSRFSVKGHLFKSLLCQLAKGDIVAVENKLIEYGNLDFSFPGSFQYSFIKDLSKAIYSCEIETFSQVCFDYDKIIPLNPWETNLLCIAKRMISEYDDDEDIDLS